MTSWACEITIPRHPKVLGLARALGLSRREALGLLVELFCWVREFAPAGEIDDGALLEEALGWPEPGELVRVLCELGWIDRTELGLEIHGWWERRTDVQEDLRRAADAERQRRRRARDRHGGRHADVTVTERDIERDASRSQHSSSDLRSGDQEKPGGDAEGGVGGTGRDGHADVTRTLAARALGLIAGDGQHTTREQEVAAIVAPSPIVLTYPCVGGRRSAATEWHLTEAQIEEWAEAFPAVDVRQQCRAALAWVRANPAKRKTAGGMPAFLARWLAREQDRGGPPRGAAPQRAPAPPGRLLPPLVRRDGPPGGDAA